MEKEKDGSVTIDLKSMLKTLWHKIYIVVITVIIAGFVSFYITAYKTEPIYRSEALMYVNNSSLSFVGGKLSITPGELDAAQSLVETYSVILKSRTTLNDVISRAELDMSYEQLRSIISVQPVNQTEIFSISVTSTDPEQAELIANTIADVLPDSIAKIVDGSSVRIVDKAVRGYRISPNVPKKTVIAMLIGAIVSSAAIILWEVLNDTIKSKDYLVDNYNIPILTVVPTMKIKSKKDKVAEEKTLKKEDQDNE